MRQDQESRPDRVPFKTVKIDAGRNFDDVAITEPAELEQYNRQPSESSERIAFLGVFESEANTDPEELAKYHRKPE